MRNICIKTLFIVITLSFGGCNAQEKVIKSISCNDDITVQYERTTAETKREGLEADEKLESFVVYFLHDFDDRVKGFVNDELLFDEEILTDEVTSNTEKYFGYSYAKDAKNPVLKISIDKKDKCFDIEIDKKYKLIYVFLTEENKWIVRFSNTYYIHN